MLTKRDYILRGLKVGEENAFAYCPHCRGDLVIKEVEASLRPVCLACGWIHYLNPPPVVCAVPYRGSGEVLLVQRGVEPKRGKWALPGGFLEIGEEPTEACLRELAEEAGIKDVGKVDLISVESQVSRRYGSVVVIGYEVEVLSEEGISPGDDAQDVRWFRVGDLPRMPFDSFERIVRKWLERF